MIDSSGWTDLNRAISFPKLRVTKSEVLKLLCHDALSFNDFSFYCVRACHEAELMGPIRANKTLN